MKKWFILCLFWRKNAVSQALWGKIAWLQRGNNLSLQPSFIVINIGVMKRTDLSNKTREELIVMNANYSKMVCMLCVMLIVFMVLSYLLLIVR